MFEQTDIIGSYWNPYVQLRQKVMEPAGEVKPETEIYYLLAKKLGFDETEMKENIPEPTDEAIEEYLNGFLKDFPELSLEQLKKGPQLADSFEEIPFSDYSFPTTSGKIELYSDVAKQLWGVDELPDYVPLEVQNEFQFQLISPNSKNRIHSQFGNLNVIRQFEPEAFLFIHPLDAEEKNMRNGEKVEMYNQQGRAEVKLQYDLGLRRGNVVLTNGHQSHLGAAPNLFTKGCETDMGHGTAFHNTWINIKKL